MRFRILFLSVLLISISGFSQEKKLAKYYFGCKIIGNGMGGLVSYGIMRISPNGATNVTYMTKNNFFLQVAGVQDSKANPEKINNWRERKIDARITKKLWKLKYAEYPYQRNEDTEGWATLKYSASPGQIRFLSKYGFKKVISEFIYGENFFLLLKDMQSPEWQYEYSMQ